MPGKLIPGEEKTPVYKKSGPFKMKGSPHKYGTIEGTTSWLERVLSKFRESGKDYDPGFTINLTKEQEERIANYDRGFSKELTKEQIKRAENYDKGFYKG